MSVTIEIPGIVGDGFSISPRRVEVPVFHALYTVKNGIIYFNRFQDMWTRVHESRIHSNSIIITLDPITALMRGLATADEIGLGGIDTLVALLKPV